MFGRGKSDKNKKNIFIGIDNLNKSIYLYLPIIK